MQREIGFTKTLTRFSQVDLILDRLENTPLDIRCELRSCGDKVLSSADEFNDEDEDKSRKVTFTGKQILALHGNRFSGGDMLEAINLYLRSLYLDRRSAVVKGVEHISTGVEHISTIVLVNI